jgi:integrase
MAHHLTDSLVRGLDPRARGNRIVYDSAVPGFGIRVTAAGAKSFVINYRVKGSGRERRYTIGAFPSWSVSEARTEAKRLRRQIDGGGDPLGDIEDQRAAPTMKDLIERFEAEHLPRKRPGTAHAYRLILKNHIAPHFGAHTKVEEIVFADIDALHRKTTAAAGPYAANRTLAVVAKMFSLAVKWGLRETNPCRGIERNTESKRKRYLSADELKRLTDALTAYPNKQIADIFRLLLLTGARRGEVRAMQWTHVDLGAGIWTKPGSTTKQKTDHVVPLSAPARQLLSEIRAEQVGKQSLGEYVFPNGHGHVVRLQDHWTRICKTAQIDGVRVHDLRHSFASVLASGGASLPLIGALLGHSNPTTTARYAHLFDDSQRAAVERVGALIVGTPAAEAVPLPKRKRR